MNTPTSAPQTPFPDRLRAAADFLERHDLPPCSVSVAWNGWTLLSWSLTFVKGDDIEAAKPIVAAFPDAVWSREDNIAGGRSATIRTQTDAFMVSINLRGTMKVRDLTELGVGL